MPQQATIYILGSGAVGLPLAAYLTKAGRSVVAVRTSQGDLPREKITVGVDNGVERLTAAVETISLSGLANLDGIMVVSTKAYANASLALALRNKDARGPLVIVQNGLGVEQPFIDAGFAQVYRCVVYVTSQPGLDHDFLFRAITPSLVGVIHGRGSDLDGCIESLNTQGFPFRAEANIQREIWKKVIVNSVFNSICPLLDVDSGVFIRDEQARALARELVRECLVLTGRLKLDLSETEMMDHVLHISGQSDGKLISTLQDIRMGRPTEIEFLNLGITRLAASMQPPLHLSRVELLGRMISAKSATRRLGRPQP